MSPACSQFWLAIAAPLAAGAALTFMLERLLKTPPLLFGRPWRAITVQTGLWGGTFAIVLAITQRPYFSALLVLAEFLFLVVVSNAKLRALREPFVFVDFEFFTDTLKHPRLFLPYLGIGRALAVCAAFGAALYLGFALEAGIPARSGWEGFTVGIAILLAASAGLLWLGTPPHPSLTFDPHKDLHRFGFPASLWYYALAEVGRPELPRPSRFSVSGAEIAGRELPDIVVVQSESFFDARRLYPGLRASLLEHFDEIRRSAVAHGRLYVPAWGGNTARTEFAFLTGFDSAALGVHRFNPHRKLSRKGTPTLADFLQRAGYRTICVHPYPASFYCRDTAYPRLGFERFVDLRDFDGAERYGPYVSDRAVADMICKLLDDSRRPTLLFAITMENHGPLHLERIAPGDMERLYDLPPPAGFEDLTVYVRHLANADRMMHMLRERLEASPRGGWLCWYGDHVPIMPKVYDATDFADGRTDYFVWGKGPIRASRTPSDIRVEELGALLLERAGLL